jgi:quinol monooxygenase YgiN
MNAKPLTLTAFFQARPGKEAELRSILTGIVAPTRREEGCINYDLHISTEKSGEFLFYENWISEAHLNRHGETPHIQALLSRIDELCAEFKLSYWEKIE